MYIKRGKVVEKRERMAWELGQGSQESILIFWGGHSMFMWDLSSKTTDQNCTHYIGSMGP